MNDELARLTALDEIEQCPIDVVLILPYLRETRKHCEEISLRSLAIVADFFRRTEIDHGPRMSFDEVAKLIDLRRLTGEVLRRRTQGDGNGTA